MTRLDTAEIHADMERWTEFPAEAPPELELLPLRWALWRIDGFTPKERDGWLITASALTGGLGECPCITVASQLILTLRFVLGEENAVRYLLQWDVEPHERGKQT